MFFYRWTRALCHGIYAVAMVIVTPAAKKIYIKVKWYWRLHGRLQSEIRNFPSRVEKYFTRFHQWPRLSKRKFRITARPSWNILYIWTMSLNVICSLHLYSSYIFFLFQFIIFFKEYSSSFKQQYWQTRPNKPYNLMWYRVFLRDL